MIANRIDYCNGVLYSDPTRVTRCSFEMVLNATARLVIDAGQYDHVTSTLHDVLHWLPVSQRIPFNLAAATFDCVRGTGPAKRGYTFVQTIRVTIS